MIKVITLRCPSCGHTVSINIGADSRYSTWHDVAAQVNDKKEYGKLLDEYMEIAEIKGEDEMELYGINPVEALNCVNYDVCGVDTVKLVDVEDDAELTVLNSDASNESIKASMEKWRALAGKEGVLAFAAMYLCPKTRTPKQGIFLSMRYMDGKKERYYVYHNKCDDCSTNLVLVDDQHIGFMHDNLPTIALCEKCHKNLVVDKVSFKVN